MKHYVCIILLICLTAEAGKLAESTDDIEVEVESDVPIADIAADDEEAKLLEEKLAAVELLKNEA